MSEQEPRISALPLLLTRRLIDHKVLHHKSLSNPLSLFDPCLPLLDFVRAAVRLVKRKPLGAGRKKGEIPAESGLNAPEPVCLFCSSSDVCLFLTLHSPPRIGAACPSFARGNTTGLRVPTDMPAQPFGSLELFLVVRVLYQEGLKPHDKRSCLLSF